MGGDGSHSTSLQVGSILVPGLIWGMAYAVIPLGLESAGPLWVAALRFDVLAVASFLLVLALERRLVIPRTRDDWAAVLVIGLLSFVAHNALLVTGQQWIRPGIVGILTGLNPALTATLVRLLPPATTLHWRTWVGLGAGFCAVLLLLPAVSAEEGPNQGLGIVLVGLAVLAWALGAVFVSRLRPSAGPISLLPWQASVAAIVLQTSAFAKEGTEGVHATSGLLWSSLYLGTATSLLAFLVWRWCVQHYGPLRANLASYVSPAAANIGGLLLFGYPIRAPAVLAYVLVATAITLVLSDSQRAGRAKEPVARVEPAKGDAVPSAVTEP